MLNFNNLGETINRNINYYWKDFNLVAFALYDKENVYLYNHPKFPPHSKPYHVFKWNKQFNGANTLIIYEEYPTAIVNLDYYNDMENIYAIVLHELFHGLQYLQEEKRFPNEFLGMTYPLLKENVELRNRERRCLYNAVTSTSKTQKLNYLKNFINLRENRRKYIENFLDYENSIETVEGPAFYVESHAYSHISSKKHDIVLNKYGKDLLDNKESTFNLRKSCCSSGLFICLIIEEINPNWKDLFFETDKLLYDLLKDVVEWEANEISNVEISMNTKSIIDYIRKDKQHVFKEFESKEGYHLLITGDIISKGFDPMNIVANETQLLHKNFLSILINDIEYHISQPVITHYKEKYNLISKLHIVLDKEPVYKNGLVSIKGLGEIQGQYFEHEGVHYINC